jgi:DNA-dependent RNA polymerase auxiliary subunit epsilon
MEWVVREGVGAGGEMTQALYAHMNKKKKLGKIRQISHNNTYKIEYGYTNKEKEYLSL